MKITEYHPLALFTKIIYEIKDGKVNRHFKNLRGEAIFEIDIPNIKRVYAYRSGNDEWWDLGVLVLFFVIVFDAIWTSFKLPIGLKLEFDFVFIFAIALCGAMSFIKRDWIGFQDEYNRYIFSIRLTKKPEVKEFIEEIKNEIGRQS